MADASCVPALKTLLHPRFRDFLRQADRPLKPFRRFARGRSFVAGISECLSTAGHGPRYGLWAERETERFVFAVANA